MLRETVGHLRDLPRYQKILAALVHYGYQDILALLNLEGLARPIEWVARVDVPPPERHKRLRLLLEELGPTFVKLGQLLSTRPDLLPESYTAELALLRDNVPPFPFEEVVRILGEEYGRPYTEVFESVGPLPVAAASISQVHRGILPSGQNVALKVRRPGIEKVVHADLDILIHLAELAEKRLPFLAPYRPLLIAKEFRRSLLRELDLASERRTMERVRHQFSGDRDVLVPATYPGLSTTRVLVMEFIGGFRVDDAGLLRDTGLDPKAVAARGARIGLKQIFRHGLFHADPHPGNMRVLPDGRIAMLDYGMFGHLDLITRERIGDLLAGLIAQETDRVLRALRDLDVRGDRVDMSALRRDISELISAYADLSLDNIDLRRLLGELTAFIRVHRLRLPPTLVLLLRSLVTIESVGRTLDPGFDIAAQLRPTLRRMAARRYSPDRLFAQAALAAEDLRRIATLLPDVLSQSLESIRRGELSLKFDLQHFENMVRQLVRASNTLAAGIVIAGLLISSSMLIRSEGLRTLGIAGLAVASVLGVWLLWMMSRDSKPK